MVILHYLLKTKISLFTFEESVFILPVSFLRNTVLFKGTDAFFLRYPIGPHDPYDSYIFWYFPWLYHCLLVSFY